MRRKACLQSNVEDAGLGSAPEAPRTRRKRPNQRDETPNLLVCGELPRIAEFETGAVAAPPFPLMQDQHALAERLNQTREAIPGEHIQVHRYEMGPLRLDPFNPPALLYPFESSHTIVSILCVRPTPGISFERPICSASSASTPCSTAPSLPA